MSRTPYLFIFIALILVAFLGIILHHAFSDAQALADQLNEQNAKQIQAEKDLLGFNTNMNPSHNVAGFIIFYKRVLL